MNSGCELGALHEDDENVVGDQNPGIDEQACIDTEKLQNDWLQSFQSRFWRNFNLHPRVQWAEVEEALKADVVSTRRLMALDAKGHEMDVIDVNGEGFVFVSTWSDVEEVDPSHTNICYDSKAAQYVRKDEEQFLNGTALEILAEIMAVSEEDASQFLADPEYHEQLRENRPVRGYSWLQTPSWLRGCDSVAYVGYGIRRDCPMTSHGTFVMEALNEHLHHCYAGGYKNCGASNFSPNISFRAKVIVNKG